MDNKCTSRSIPDGTSIAHESLGDEVLVTLDVLTNEASYSWPGNIRELRNAVERAMILATKPELTIPVPKATFQGANRSAKLDDVQKTHIRNVLETTGWRIRGIGGAADRLGLKPTTLETRMAKLGLVRPRAS